MKRALTLIAAFVAVTLLTVAAQAAPEDGRIVGQKPDVLSGCLKTLK